MNIEAKGLPIPALNFHVWQPCNMGCRYCFAEFADAIPQLRLEKAHLRERALRVIRAASKAGIQKLTLVGGEPTLCPWLGDLLRLATELGMVTMVVSNGSRMTATWLELHAPWLDWAAISVDSLFPETNQDIGRTVGNGIVPEEDHYLRLFAELSAHGIRTKMNTVVSALNWQEDMSAFVRRVQPERWKVLQALHVRGENDRAFPEMAVTAAQFEAFVARHRALGADLMLAPEDNDAMTGSYLMVDPLGRFFSNASGRHEYSRPIWEVGWTRALAQVEVSTAKFEKRGGEYDWGGPKSRG